MLMVNFTHAENTKKLVVPEEISVILRQTSMPDMDDSRLGKILQRYYVEGLGGAENWQKIESMRLTGTLSLESGDFQINAYQKKPHFMKMTIEGNRQNLTLGYDGEKAWRIIPGPEPKPMLMEHQEARRFIHSSQFGNYLIYPYALGKEIYYIDTVPVEGKICHQIRVILDTGFQIDYFIDIRTYLEIMVKNTDLETGFVNSIVYDGYIFDHGMPVAKDVQSWENDKLVSELEIDEIKVNTGLMPWMFHMPDYIEEQSAN